MGHHHTHHTAVVLTLPVTNAACAFVCLDREPALLGSLKLVGGVSRLVMTNYQCEWYKEQQRPHHVYVDIQGGECLAEVVERMLAPKAEARVGGIVRQGKAASGLDLFTDALFRPIIQLVSS